MKTIGILLQILGTAQFLIIGASAETRTVHSVSLSSGALSNPGAEPRVIVVGLLNAPGAERMRVPLSTATLGAASTVRFVSLKDGQSQTLDAAQLTMWAKTSALFNGASVRLEVILAPGDSEVSVQVQQVFGFVDRADPDKGADCCGGVGPRTLCGPDDRVASGDNRVGRINGNCTAWLVANGGVLTAGHCLTAAGQIFEVNIPASLANGNRVASAVADQFPVIAGSITFMNAGIGNDWTVCRIGPNTVPGQPPQRAHDLHGFFRMTRELPPANAATRVTGCGFDNMPAGSQPGVCGNFDTMGNCTHFGLNAQNQTLQTSTGTFSGQTGTSLQYAVDTEPANSGSPIIWEGNGFTIGIHTHGGCTATGGANNGTRFGLVSLENAIAGVPGANCRYLDLVKAPSGTEDGTVFQPHDTLAEAVNAVPVVPGGGRLSIVRGTYSVPPNTTITKAMTITAPVGPVTIGQ